MTGRVLMAPATIEGPHGPYDGGPGHPMAPKRGADDKRCAARLVGGLRGRGEVVQRAMGGGRWAEGGGRCAEAAAEAKAEGKAIIGQWVVIVRL